MKHGFKKKDDLRDTTKIPKMKIVEIHQQVLAGNNVVDTNETLIRIQIIANDHKNIKLINRILTNKK